jgi:CRISPR-associated protein Cas6
MTSLPGRTGIAPSDGLQVDRVVDLVFPLRGKSIPADHGYPLFSALCRVIPWIHSDDMLGVHAINGRIEAPRRLVLTQRSTLRLRLAADRIPDCISLTGQQLDIDDGDITLGFPSLVPLVPSTSGFSRLVTIRGFTEAEPFLDAVRRQLTVLDIEGMASLVPRPATQPREESSSGGSSPWVRRTLRVRDKDIVGFALRVDHLTAEESLRLQEHGLGGRRHFGCGLFLAPARDGR